MEFKHNHNTYVFTAKFDGKNFIEDYEDYKNIKAKLEVDGVFYRYRTYYKCVWDEKKEREQKILTFIMFNPSTANQYSLDPTLRNCKKLAENEFDGMEIYNLITVRQPKVIETMNLYKIEKNDDEKNPLFKDSFNEKTICLAWGGKISKPKNSNVDNEEMKKYNEIKTKLINRVIEKFKETEGATFYVYGAEENTKEFKARHPSPLSYIKVKQPVLKKLENIEELVR